MPIRVESDWYFNPERGQICGLDPLLQKPAIRYQIKPWTRFSREAWESWWNGESLAITYRAVFLRTDVGNPPVVEATEIKAVSAGIPSGQIPEIPQYLEHLK